jgi:hypothetical protein
LPWEQGCKVQVGSLSVVSQQRYSADDNQGATLTVKSTGSIIGHCGDHVTVTGSLTAEDGTVQTATLDAASFNTSAGFDNTFDVSKFAT